MLMVKAHHTHLAVGKSSVSTASFKCLLDAHKAFTSPPEASHASPTNRLNAPAASLRFRRISKDLGAPNVRILRGTVLTGDEHEEIEQGIACYDNN